MGIAKIVGVVLIILGSLALAYGGFTYTRDRDTVEFGPVEFEVREKERVSVPVWAGLTAVIVGTALILVPGKRT